MRDLVVRDLNEKCSFVLWYSTGWVVLYSLRTLKHLSKTVGIWHISDLSNSLGLVTLLVA